MTRNSVPSILLQRDIQRVDRFQIQVIRRFVEHQHVGLLQHQLAEDQPRGFAAGERLGRLHALFALEQHLPEQAAQFFVARRRIELLQPVENRSCPG